MLVGFSSFPHGLELLEGNIFCYKEEPLNNGLTISRVNKMPFIERLLISCFSKVAIDQSLDQQAIACGCGNNWFKCPSILVDMD